MHMHMSCYATHTHTHMHMHMMAMMKMTMKRIMTMMIEMIHVALERGGVSKRGVSRKGGTAQPKKL